MASVTAKDKVAQLEDAVLRNDVDTVRNLYKKYERFEFTARAVGYAMRFCGLNMVRALLENGASLDYLMTKNLYDTYECGYSINPSTAFDYAMSLFPKFNIPASNPDKKVISAKERLKVIKYLVEQNIPTIHNFLYFSILGNDEPIFEYLASHHVNVLPSPYKEIVSGNASYPNLQRAGLGEVVLEFSRMLEKYDDKTMAQIIERFAHYVSGKIPLMRYEVVSLQRACSPELFPACAQFTDLRRKYARWDIINYLLKERNVPGIKFILENKWLQNAGDLNYLVDEARKQPDPSPEILAVLMEFTQNTKKAKKSTRSVSADTSLSLEDKPVTLAQVRKNWGCRKLTDGNYEIFSYKGTETEVVIPSHVSGGKVTSVTPSTFYTVGPGVDARMGKTRAQITSIEFPGTIERIPDNMFADNLDGSMLETVILNEGTTEIGDGAFFGCVTLKQIIMPRSLRKLGISAFKYCASLTNIELPDELTEIPICAFQESGLTEISLPESVRTIAPRAFAGCKNLKAVHLSSKIHMGAAAFHGCTGLANADGQIIVDGTLFSSASAKSFAPMPIDELAKPVALAPDVRQVDEDLYDFPLIMYRKSKNTNPDITATLRLGAQVTFGRFPLDLTFDLQPLEWRVIKLKDGCALLLCEKAIMRQPGTWRDDSFWPDSWTRQILNHTFYKVAFSATERARIVTANLKGKAPQYMAKTSNTTTNDNVFLLSEDEFNIEVPRKQVTATATPYALAQAFPNPTQSTAVRSVSGDDAKSTNDHVCWSLRTYGTSANFVDVQGKVNSQYWYRPDNSYLRPALWIQAK